LTLDQHSDMIQNVVKYNMSFIP